MKVEYPNNVRTTFGPRDIESKVPYAVDVYGPVRALYLNVVHDDLLVHTEGDATGAYLPAGSVVTGVTVMPADETFAGGTSYAVKMVEDDGTAISDLVAAITLAQMNSGVVATVADATVGSDDAYIEVEATGTFTAGAGKVIVHYIERP